jgi:hypothetical protein
MTNSWKLGLAAAILMGTTSVTFADDWMASKLFGNVLQLVDGQWQPVVRGDTVPDGRVIRTVGFGRATFTRGNETVDVGANTQIQIFDEKRQKPFTTVKQYFGTVSVEAQVEEVQHFAVQTPYLAAVVKGTRFTVNSGETGASVSVQRGHVAVEDKHDHTHVLLEVGQSAKVDVVATESAIVVSGDGDLPEVVASNVVLPTYVNTDEGKGKSGQTEDGSGKSSSNGNSGGGSGKSGNGNGNSGNGNGNSGNSNGNSGNSNGNSGNSNGNSGNSNGNSGNSNGNSGNGNGNSGSDHSGKGKDKGGDGDDQ